MNEYIEKRRAIDILDTANGLVKGVKLGPGKVLIIEYAKQLQESYMNLIRDMPSAMVKPIIYAEWNDVGKTSKDTPIRQCSYCKTTKAGRPKYNYCPDCGAKMCSGILDDQLIIPEV